MHILITGGTGFIGRHLVKALGDVTCLVRKTSNTRGMDCEFLEGDILKPVDCSGYDVVYHLAGMLGKWGTRREDYFRLHVEGTRNLLKTCRGKFIYLSSAGVLGPVENADESFPYNPTNDYEESKAEAEKLVREYHDHVIIRPEFVYGPGDTHVLGLFHAIRDRRFFLIGDGMSLLHPTYVDDVVSCLVNAVNVSNEIYNVAGDKPVSVREFTRIAADELGVHVNKLRIPLILARAYVALTDKQRRFHPILTRSRLDFFTQTRTFNTRKARREVGLKPIDLKIGIRNTVEY